MTERDDNAATANTGLSTDSIASRQSSAASQAGTPTRQYASINILPSPQDKARKPGAIAAAAAPIASLVSPIINHTTLNGADAAVPLTGGSGGTASARVSAEFRSRASTASYHGSGIDANENVPFTYSGVFSHNVWNNKSAGSNGTSSATAFTADNHADINKTTDECSHIQAVGRHVFKGQMPGVLFPGKPAYLSHDEDEDTESEDEDGDEDESDAESYEGMAVEDIHETYDQDLPEYVPNPDPYTQSIYLDEEGIAISVRGMSYSPLSLWAYCAVSIFTCGLVPLLCRWVPRWKISWTMRPALLGEADFVVAVDEFGGISIEEVRRRFYGGTLESIFGSLTRTGPLQDHKDDVVNNLSMFSHRYYRFIYHPYLEKFLPNTCWMDSLWTRSPASIRSGLAYDVKTLRSTIFGENSIDIEEKSVVKLLFDEVLNPFYVFQAGSVILWCFDNYYYYASCILIISISGIVETLVETRRNTRKIKEMAHFTCPVRILRDGCWRESIAEDLLPGDVFEMVPSMRVLPCDAVLLEGDCIVNESMLTGESVPVAKTPVVPAVFGKMRLASSTFGADIAKHVLFAGTKLVRVKKTSPGFGGSQWLSLESRDSLGMPARATAMALRTGFNTTKGALIRSILFPRPNKFKFYEDSFKFICVLAIIAVIGFVASIGNFLRLGLTAHIIIVRALDLITVVVPPALPSSLAIGVSFALSRLRKNQIYCISPTRINVCGKINVMCFDKTGTLTEEGLDVLGVRTVDHDSRSFNDLQEDPRLLPVGASVVPSAPSSAFSSVDSRSGIGNSPGLGLGLVGLARSSSVSAPRKPVDPSKLSAIHALATCHAVKLVEGQLVGDPLDVKMFESTGWVLEESEEHMNGNSQGQRNGGGGGGGGGGGNRPTMPVPTVVRPPNSSRFTLDAATGSANVYELGIIRTFDFSAALRRQSVVVKRLGAKYNEIYVKGSPESVRELCLADTIPHNFDKALLEYTNHGYRVIAIAGRPLKMAWPKLQRLKRDAVELGLVFMGFLVFENKLKPTSAPVLDELRSAKIRQIMCTGDNVLTAISVGKECGMVPADMQVFVPRLVRTKDPRQLSPPEGRQQQQQQNEPDGGNCVRAMVVWESTNDEMRVLDPYTLEPRIAKSPVNDELVASDAAETAEEMQEQQRLYFNWLHNFTDADASLATNGGFCVAVTGEVFRFIMDEAPALTVERMLMRGAIYARMSPDEKAELVERLQSLGYCTGFCGDGANDCSALRAADVGLSLSEAEASVAAPFTSHSTDIQCVLEVIREGRAALVTSFSCFKYMALYSIIQFTSVSLLYEFGGGLGDFQFLYIDLFIIVPLAVFMGRTPAFHKIAPKRPTANLMSKRVLTSLFGQIAINSGIQFLVYGLVKKSPSYRPPVREDPTDLDSLLILSFENTALFLSSCFQYILVACVFSIGPPYRESNLRNTGLVATCALLVLFTLFVTLLPNKWANSVFELVDLSSGFRQTVVVWAAINLVLSSIGENWVFPWLAPTMAKLLRIAKYLARRYLPLSTRQYYTEVPSADGHAAVGASAQPSGRVSATAGDSSLDVDVDLEGGRAPLTWEQATKKADMKPYKRIQREMGIPIWY